MGTMTYQKRDHDFTKITVTNGLTPTSTRGTSSFPLKVVVILLVIGVGVYLI